MPVTRGPVGPIALVVVLLVALPATGCARAQRKASPSTTTTSAPSGSDAGPAGTPVGLVDINAGACFNDVADPTRKPLAVLVVDCAVPHTYEAYDVITWSPPNGAGAPGRGYPGKDQMRLAAEDSCYTTFEAWMGVEWKRSDYDIATWWPSADSWAKADRTILCAVFKAVGGTTTGSVRGTGQ